MQGSVNSGRCRGVLCTREQRQGGRADGTVESTTRAKHQSYKEEPGKPPASPTVTCVTAPQVCPHCGTRPEYTAPDPHHVPHILNAHSYLHDCPAGVPSLRHPPRVRGAVPGDGRAAVQRTQGLRGGARRRPAALCRALRRLDAAAGAQVNQGEPPCDWLRQQTHNCLGVHS